jgi:hypothetical protein
LVQSQSNTLNKLIKLLLALENMNRNEPEKELRKAKDNDRKPGTNLFCPN